MENYRYSCSYCNSRRVAENSSGGKQDHFPLLNPDQRAWTPENDLGLERPELLDPCDPDDPKLLTFIETGAAHETHQDPAAVERRRARTSIELYHLNHIEVKRERKRLAIIIRNKVEDIQRLEADNPRTDIIVFEIKKLKKNSSLWSVRGRLFAPRREYIFKVLKRSDGWPTFSEGTFDRVKRNSGSPRDPRSRGE